MAAPKGEKELNKLFDKIIKEITEEGKSALSAITGKMSTATFYKLLEEEDKKKLNKYVRAVEIRTERMAEDIINIADNQEGDVYTNEDGIEFTNHNVINRSRLRVDARKWVMAKMNPRKYGDKIDMTSGGEPIKNITGINYIVPDGDNPSTDK